jgi:Fe-S cluster assembly iron-binding protein IscA
MTNNEAAVTEISHASETNAYIWKACALSDGRTVVVEDDASLSLSDGRTVVVDDASLPLSDGRTVVVDDASLSLSDGRTVVVDDASLSLSDGRTVVVDDASLPLSDGRTVVLEVDVRLALDSVVAELLVVLEVVLEVCVDIPFADMTTPEFADQVCGFWARPSNTAGPHWLSDNRLGATDRS